MNNTVTTLVCTMLLMASTAVAQKGRVGFQGGGTFSWLYNDLEEEPGMAVTLGVMSDLVISKHFIFQPNLNYVSIGFKKGENSRTDLHYLELPLNFLYRSDMSSGFFIGAGPYASMGIGGKIKYKDHDDIQLTYGEDGDLRRFCYGVNVVSGYLFPSGVQIALNFNVGLSKFWTLDYTYVDGVNPKTRYAGIRVGYLLK